MLGLLGLGTRQALSKTLFVYDIIPSIELPDSYSVTVHKHLLVLIC